MSALRGIQQVSQGFFEWVVHGLHLKVYLG
jgi:hypothetical protein